MAMATEIALIAPGIYFWQAFDPKVKADLCSSAVDTQSGLFFIDPIPLERESLEEVGARHEIAGIVVTNENHERATDAFAERFRVPVFGGKTPSESRPAGRCQPVSSAQEKCAELTAIPVPGAPAGETALHFASQGGTMLIGDALINLDPYGFSLLPAKYCTNARLMRRSLESLLDYRFERMLFAHGTPLVSNARVRLEQLLASSS